MALEYEKLFEIAQTGLMFITGDLIMIKANQKLADMFGYASPEDMVGISMRELHDDEGSYNSFGKQHYPADLSKGVSWSFQDISMQKESAITMAQKIRTNIEHTHLLKERRVTISIGVAEVIEVDTIDSLFKRADDNLYYAKQHGRNQVIAHI